MKTFVEFEDIKTVINGTIEKVTSITANSFPLDAPHVTAYTSLNAISFIDLCNLRDRLEDYGAIVSDVQVNASATKLNVRITFVRQLEIITAHIDKAQLKQFRELKKKHPDAVLLFRTNDYYESYEADAEVVAKVLGIDMLERPIEGTQARITLTSFPYHQLDIFLPKLVRSGNRVAICDQLDPKPKDK